MNQELNAFIFRTPLLKLKQVVETDLQLLQIFENVTNREALFIASKDLYTELIDLEKGVIIDAAKKKKILISLYKYHTRMCTRCTPFGLFSGINLGNFSNSTQLQLNSQTIYKKRFDMDYLCNLFYEISKNESFYSGLAFSANNTLYKVLDQWRYVEYKFMDDYRIHNLVSIDDSVVLTDIISNSNAGVKYTELVKIVEKYGFSAPEIQSFLHELIQSQVLVSDVYPSISGQEYQFRLFERLEQTSHPIYGNLNKQIIEVLDQEANIISNINKLTHILSDCKIEIKPNKLLQIDLLKIASISTLDYSIRTEIEEATNLLLSIYVYDKRNTPLERFKIAFSERYENSFVPLATVMDTDIGIGYKNAISQITKGSTPEVRKDVSNFKRGLLTKSITDKIHVVQITEDHIKNFVNKNKNQLSGSYSFLGSLMYQDSSNYKIKYNSAGGGSALGLMGRFGHSDSNIEKLCMDIAEKEESFNTNTILAEIVHLPQGRIGNVVSRPHYRKFEIPYLSYSTKPIEEQVKLEDLYVGMIQDRMILFSKRLNKEILPKLANAHNYVNDSLPTYHFLCDLQFQSSIPAVFWSWDELYDEAFLPRIEYKNVILSPARWKIDTKIFKSLAKDDSLDVMESTIKDLKLPMKFLISQGDNELYVDLSNPLGRQTFLKVCAKVDSLIVHEFLFNETNSLDGYTNEIIVPYINSKYVPYVGVKKIEIFPSSLEICTPLSNWIYFKIYTGPKYANRILKEIFPYFIDDLISQGIIEKWFFIRYTDPKYHLRLRFLIKDKNNTNYLFETINKYFEEYIDNNIIWDLQISSYRRELDRYGSLSIDEVETWFCLNSQLVLNLLNYFPNFEKKEDVLCCALVSIFILDQFGYSESEKQLFVDLQVKTNFNDLETNMSKQLKKNLDSEFRTLHQDLKNVFAFSHSDEKWKGVRDLIDTSSQSTIPIIKIIISKYNNDPNQMLRIVSSFIHMFVNRFFDSDQRAYEIKIYYFLSRFLLSESARKKINASVS